MNDDRNAGMHGLPDTPVQFSVPDDGIRGDGVLLRFARAEDIDVILPAFSDPEIREAGNLPNVGREEMLQMVPHLPRLVASGRLMPLTVVAGTSGEVFGGCSLHHLDAERASVEIGYWLLPSARGRGVATQVARLLAEHAFSLGVQRVVAYVNVGNAASERVLERAGYTREGVARSLPKPDGTRVDKTQYSLLPGD